MAAYSQSIQIEDLAEEFLARLRRGDDPSVDEYANQYAHLAQEIRDFFPALKLVEAHKPDAHSAAAAGDIECDKAANLERAPLPVRLGDFLLLREIGRGGMGVVYEAVQESLGRPVALKVLEAHPLSRVPPSKRFAREVRAAARLHHTNIVPVFSVGEHHGIHFYAMQFIDGLGLDKVLEELRRMEMESGRAAASTEQAKPRTPSQPQQPNQAAGDGSSERNESSTAVARSLLSGRWDARRARESQPELPDGGESRASLASRASPLPRESKDRSGALPTAGQAACPTASLASPLQPRGPRAGWHSPYWHSVARIGVQVAEALQHAHDHGVLHRDIKPSNLLLDERGTVWVTDFGLAKADDHDDLTLSGDMLGTMRYMASEQFAGQADPRSDVYALGLTLYELLALRPAFNQSNRHQLLKQVTTETPDRLRAIAPRIPADLETIVHKAIEREPAHRYQTAAELADDLKRYLNEVPIRARRLSLPARLGRWARRNPAPALLVAVLFLLAVGLPLVAVRFDRLAQQARTAQLKAQSREYLVDRSQATAWRVSGQSGRQFNTVRALAAAVELHRKMGLDASDLDAMRDEAIAALAMPDLHPETQWTVPEPRLLSLMHFDPELEHYTIWRNDPPYKGLSVRRVADDSEVVRLEKINGSSEKARFSRDGRLIRVTAGSGCVEVWDWRLQEMVYRAPKKASVFAHDFSSDSKLLAVGHEDATVTVHDLAKGKQIAEFQVAAAPFVVAFHPTQPQLAVSCESANCVQVWGLEPQRLLRTLPHPSDVFSLAWHPTGRCLAVVEGSDIHLWDLATEADEPFRILRGHAFVVNELLFHPSGRLLYSHASREGKTGVWDPYRGQHLLWCDGLLSTISRDGGRLGFYTSDQVGVWSVSAGEACVWPPSYGSEIPHARFCQYSPAGRLLAFASAQGVYVWCPETWQLLAHVPVSTHSVCFDATGSSLLAAHDEGLVRYRLQRDASGLQLERADGLELPANRFAFHVALAGNSLFADLNTKPNWTTTGEAVLIDLASRSTRVLQGAPELCYTAVTADGRWAASGNKYGANVTIWDVLAGTQAVELLTKSTTSVAFSPDSRLLATASISEITIWEVGSWKEIRAIPRSGDFAALAWSSDSRLLAATSGSDLQLIDVASGRIVATLTSPDNPGYAMWLAFRPQGDQLAACCAGDGLRVWDLQKLRLGLRQVDLDWELAP